MKAGLASRAAHLVMRHQVTMGDGRLCLFIQILYLCVCMYFCVYVCVVCVFVYFCVYVHVCVVCVFLCVCVCCVCISVCVCVCCVFISMCIFYFQTLANQIDILQQVATALVNGGQYEKVRISPWLSLLDFLGPPLYLSLSLSCYALAGWGPV